MWYTNLKGLTQTRPRTIKVSFKRMAGRALPHTAAMVRRYLWTPTLGRHFVTVCRWPAAWVERPAAVRASWMHCSFSSSVAGGGNSNANTTGGTSVEAGASVERGAQSGDEAGQDTSDTTLRRSTPILLAVFLCSQPSFQFLFC